MNTEEKQLLFIDLCARLPYGVVVDRTYIPENNGYTSKLSANTLDFVLDDNWSIKPYLRPMSSMTEEEKKMMRSCGFELIPYNTGHTGFANIKNYIDEVSFRFMEEFLNAHHFDYRGLIPMGFALEAKEGMYV